jgi:mRNA-degrading endonuclease RelE of RelBE toxin-antitoxin system
MKYEFKPSFDRSVKSLPHEIQKEVKELCITLIRGMYKEPYL